MIRPRTVLHIVFKTENKFNIIFKSYLISGWLQIREKHIEKKGYYQYFL